MKTPEQKEFIVQSYKDGKKIQEMRLDVRKPKWIDVVVPEWNWDYCNYRVKPENEIKPYKSEDEFLEAAKEHGLFLKEKQNKAYRLPIAVLGDSVVLNNLNPYIKEYTHCYDLGEILEFFIWQDGEPCGVKEE